MRSRSVHKGALVAVALVLAGCSATGTEGPTSSPAQQGPSKESEQAEARHREVTRTAEQQRRAKREEAARANLEAARAKLNEGARARPCASYRR